MFRRIVFVFVAALLLLPGASFAQVASSITGIIKDSSGGAVPGVTVKAVNELTTKSLESVSDGQGAFRIDDVVPGTYRVEAVLDGFETATRRLVVDAGQVPAAIDFTLVPARLTEAVVVTARRIEETVQDVPLPVSVV